MCNALEHAHLKKIIHRDLKSGNFILLKDDFGGTLVKILDFGIAKIQDDTQRLTVEGKSLGSPLYMSPEQCTGATLTPSSDVYSLGVVAYEMVTGKLPYQRASIVEIMTAHCDPKIRPESLQTHRPDLPGLKQLDQVLQKALETRIENRFSNMYQFRQGIEFWINAVRQGHTMAAVPEEIMVNRVDPAEERSAEIKKSMHHLMEVRREQLGKTTTHNTVERPKFVSEMAPRKPKGKLILQLFMLFALFAILTLSMAVLVIANIDKARNLGWSDITRQFDSILGKNQTPSQQVSPPAVPISPETETPAPETAIPEGADGSEQTTEKKGSTDSAEEPGASNSSDSVDSRAGTPSSTPAGEPESQAPSGSAGSSAGPAAGDPGAEQPTDDASPKARTTSDTSNATAPEALPEATSVKQSETSNRKGAPVTPPATTGGSKTENQTESNNQSLPDKTPAPGQPDTPEE
jgi:serine/threonine protein kinase